MRDLKNNSIAKAIFPALRRGDATTPASSYTGTVIDLKGEGRKFLALLTIGAANTCTVTLTIQESADNSTWATLYAYGSLSTIQFIVVDLKPTKRYIRAIATLSQTNTYYIDFALGGLVYNERYQPSNVA